MDRNDHYGGSTASLTLSQVRRTREKQHKCQRTKIRTLAHFPVSFDRTLADFEACRHATTVLGEVLSRKAGAERIGTAKRLQH